MDKSAIEEIKPYGTKNLYSNIFRTALLSVILVLGAVIAMYNIWQTDGLRYGITAVSVIFTACILSLVQLFKNTYGTAIFAVICIYRFQRLF